jgi:hypothetical protein
MMLGILNLRLQNDALLLKQLHKFYNKKDIPWIHLIWNRYYSSKVPHASSDIGSFWWKDLLKLNILYRGIAKCSLGDGSSITFWEDLGAGDVLSHKFPRLFSFVRNEIVSVKHVMQAADLDSLFHLPLSPEAFDEMLQLQDLVSLVPYDHTSKDSWFLSWGTQEFSSHCYYQSIFSTYRPMAFSKQSGSQSVSPVSNFLCG